MNYEVLEYKFIKRIYMYKQIYMENQNNKVIKKYLTYSEYFVLI